MHNDIINLATIYRETTNRLEVFTRRVQEGKDVMPASEFCRWLEFSGILPLMLTHTNQEQGPFKIDGSLLRWRCDQLLDNCNERLRTGNENPTFEKLEFQSIHEKIDRMAGYLSRLSVAPAVSVAPIPAEHLTVISGGLSAQAPGDCVPVGRRSA
jgi:hypothetical protein